MVFLLVILTALLLAAVDCATLGRKAKHLIHNDGDGYCHPEGHDCHFSYMISYQGLMLEHHTYIKSFHDPSQSCEMIQKRVELSCPAIGQIQPCDLKQYCVPNTRGKDTQLIETHAYRRIYRKPVCPSLEPYLQFITVPEDWQICTETEPCSAQNTDNNWSTLLGHTKTCGIWDRCQQHQGLQSPVNLNPRHARYQRFYPRYINARDVPGNFTNNGHSPTFTVESKGVDPSEAVIFKGVPDREESDYIFYELHFHIGNTTKKEIGSEHSVNNRFHDGEIHLVHWKRDHVTPTPDRAAEADDGLMAIGVFFDVDDSSDGRTYVDYLIQNYVKNIEELYRCISVTVNPELILPKTGCVYSYAGSKTTPPCMETLRFLIYSKSITISRESYNILANLETSDGPTGHAILSDYGNRRPIQRRPVHDLVTNCCYNQNGGHARKHNVNNCYGYVSKVNKHSGYNAKVINVSGNIDTRNIINRNRAIMNAMTIKRNKAIRNTIKGNKAIRNTINRSKAIRNTINRNKAKRNTVKRNKAIRNTVKRNKAIRNTIKGNKAIRNTINRNKAIRNTINKNKAIRNTVKRNKAIRNTIKRNKAIRNTVKRNKAIRNTVKRNKAIRNTINRNKAIRNTVKRNKAIRNTVKRKKTIMNTIKRNKAIRNTVKRNKSIRNTATRNIVNKIKVIKNIANRNTAIRHNVNRKKAIRNIIKRNKAIRNIVIRNKAIRDTVNRNKATRNIGNSNKVIRNTVNSKKAIRNIINRNRSFRNTVIRNKAIRNIVNRINILRTLSIE